MTKRRLYLLSLTMVVLLGPPSTYAQSPNTPVDSTTPVDEALRSFLIEHLERWDPTLSPTDSSIDANVRYTVASMRLADSGPPVDLVFLIGKLWCGTGGCTTLVVGRASGKHKIISEMRLSREPIIVLPTTHHGWHDLSVVSVGGGKLVADRATYRYDGHGYVLHAHIPMNASGNKGHIALSESTPLAPLYRCRRPLVGLERQECSLPGARRAPTLRRQQ